LKKHAHSLGGEYYQNPNHTIKNWNREGETWPHASSDRGKRSSSMQRREDVRSYVGTERRQSDDLRWWAEGKSDLLWARERKQTQNSFSFE